MARRFCCELAGVAGISDRFATSAIERGREGFGGAMDDLLETFEQGGLKAVERSEHVEVARAVTYFLYTGLLPEVTPDSNAAEVHAVPSEDDYFESLAWRVVQAHPRGLSGGYFGHWHYPPEDDDGAG